MEQQEILRMVGKAWDGAWRNIGSANAQNVREIVAATRREAKQEWDAHWWDQDSEVRDAAWDKAWTVWNSVWDTSEVPAFSTFITAMTAALAAAETVAIMELSEAEVSAPKAEKGRQGQPWILA